MNRREFVKFLLSGVALPLVGAPQAKTILVTVAGGDVAEVTYGGRLLDPVGGNRFRLAA